MRYLQPSCAVILAEGSRSFHAASPGASAQQRASKRLEVMSDVHPRTDIGLRDPSRRDVPFASKVPRSKWHLFDPPTVLK